MLGSFLTKEAAARFSKEQEMEFLRQYQETGDEKALKKLKISLRPIVQRVISQARPNSDEMSVAQLAIRADGELPAILKKYNPNEAALNTYVMNQLKYLMSNAVKENLLGAHVPRPEQDKLFAYRQGLSQAQVEFGPNPTPKQILKFAPTLETPDELTRIKQYNKSTLIGDAKMEMEDGGFLQLKDKFNNNNFGDNDRLHSLEMDRLRQLMNELDEQEKRIINEYVFNNKSMMDVALSLGLSSSQVRKTILAWKQKLAERGYTQ